MNNNLKQTTPGPYITTTLRKNGEDFISVVCAYDNDKVVAVTAKVGADNEN